MDTIEQTNRMLEDKIEIVDKGQKGAWSHVKKFEIHCLGKRAPSNIFIWEGDEWE